MWVRISLLDQPPLIRRLRPFKNFGSSSFRLCCRHGMAVARAKGANFEIKKRSRNERMRIKLKFQPRASNPGFFYFFFFFF